MPHGKDSGASAPAATTCVDAPPSDRRPARVVPSVRSAAWRVAAYQAWQSFSQPKYLENRPRLHRFPS